MSLLNEGNEVCKFCAAAISETALFCNSCGKKVETISVQCPTKPMPQPVNPTLQMPRNFTNANATSNQLGKAPQKPQQALPIKPLKTQESQPVKPSQPQHTLQHDQKAYSSQPQQPQRSQILNNIETQNYIQPIQQTQQEQQVPMNQQLSQVEQSPMNPNFNQADQSSMNLQLNKTEWNPMNQQFQQTQPIQSQHPQNMQVAQNYQPMYQQPQQQEMNYQQSTYTNSQRGTAQKKKSHLTMIIVVMLVLVVAAAGVYFLLQKMNETASEKDLLGDWTGTVQYSKYTGATLSSDMKKNYDEFIKKGSTFSATFTSDLKKFEVQLNVDSSNLPITVYTCSKGVLKISFKDTYSEYSFTGNVDKGVKSISGNFVIIVNDTSNKFSFNGTWKLDLKKANTSSNSTPVASTSMNTSTPIPIVTNSPIPISISEKDLVGEWEGYIKPTNFSGNYTKKALNNLNSTLNKEFPFKATFMQVNTQFYVLMTLNNKLFDKCAFTCIDGKLTINNIFTESTQYFVGVINSNVNNISGTFENRGSGKISKGTWQLILK